jgi:hypothetical protein
MDTITFTCDRATAASFVRVFNKMLQTHIYRGEAYEATEQLHLQQYGRRRFSEYQNFLAARRRLKL